MTKQKKTKRVCRNCGKITNKTFCSRKCILEYKEALRYASDNPKPKYETEKESEG